MKKAKKKILIIINPISGVRPKNNNPTLKYEKLNISQFKIKIEDTE